MSPYIDTITPKHPAHPLLLLAVALAICAATAHAADVNHSSVKPKLSPAAARTIAMKDLKKLLQFARRPDRASIVELSRQFGFNYKVEVCHAVESADDWCWYDTHYARVPAASIQSAGFGTHKRTRLPTARIWLQVLDKRVCFSAAELEELFGPGEHFATPIPILSPGDPVPTLERFLIYRSVPGGGAFALEAAYRGPCMSSVEIRF